ncbi:hypothetical protein Droror1_Dr00018541 [Drosera rotundifolia]
MMLGGLISRPPLSSPSLHLTRPLSNAVLLSATIFPTQTLHLHHHLTPPKPPGRCGCIVFALKKRNARGRGGSGGNGGGNGKATVLEAEVVDKDEDEEELEFSEDDDDELDFLDVFDDDVNDDDEEEEEEEEFEGTKYGKLKSWMKKKPTGFGEGKEYDTSLEEKLLEEIEQSRIAQLANINRLKLEASRPMSKKLEKAPEVIPSGIRVLITNLPKKRNIHRDLKSAFKEVSGIISISPMVSGNKKTRDPICKGLAYVYFKSMDDANRFIDLFSGQTVTFGKAVKKLKYELVNSSDSDDKETRDEKKKTCAQATTVTSGKGEKKLKYELVSSNDSDDKETRDEKKKTRAQATAVAFGKVEKLKYELVNSSDSDDKESRDAKKQTRAQATLMDIVVEGQKRVDSNNNELSLSLREDDDPESFQEIMDEVPTEDSETSTASQQDYGTESSLESTSDLSPSAKTKKKNEADKKSKVKKKKTGKSPALSITGAAKRLKLKEKAMLAGVFSKYAKEFNPASEGR